MFCVVSVKTLSQCLEGHDMLFEDEQSSKCGVLMIGEITRLYQYILPIF
jgi:hypothetical protein